MADKVCNGLSNKMAIFALHFFLLFCDQGVFSEI